MNDKQKESLFQKLFVDNRDRIYRLTLLYCREMQDRQDLLQDIFYQIWRSLDSFRNESQIDTWVYRIAINTGINSCRRHRTRNRWREKWREDVELAEPVSQPDPTDEEIQRLYSCIQQLSPVDQTLVHLYLERLSNEKIAEILAISEINVRVRVHRIKQRIKTIWENEYGPME